MISRHCRSPEQIGRLAFDIQAVPGKTLMPCATNHLLKEHSKALLDYSGGCVLPPEKPVLGVVQS